MNIKRKLTAMFATVLLCTSLAGCNSGNSKDKASEDKSKNIVIGANQFPSNLDPAVEFNGWYVSMYGVGETLVKFNKNMEIQPLVSDSWKRVDNLTWKFHIREGVKFQDGEPVTAKAVKSSLERSLKVNSRAQELLGIKSITVNGQDVTITTKTQDESFLGNIADPLAIIVNTNAKEDTFAKNPVCTGPFKVKSFTENAKAVVEKNKDYWGDKAQVDEATFKYIKDGNTRSMALQSGEIDVAQSVTDNNMSLFQDKSKYNIDKINSLRIVMSYVNFNNEFLKDPAVRKAIALGLDRDTYAKKLLKDSAVSAVGPFPTNLPFVDKNLKGHKYDKKAATKILADAGYKDADGDGILEKDGKKLTLNLALYTTRAELPIIGEAMQSQLKEIGIATKLQSYESVSKVLKSGNFDLCLYSVNTATSGDPQSFLDLYFKTGASENYGKYSNKEVDALIDKLKSEKDSKARKDITTKVQEKLLEDNSNMFLVTPKLNIVSKNTVTGITMYPIDYYLLDNKVSIK